jgi:CRISPR-associated endonuclease Cas1
MIQSKTRLPAAEGPQSTILTPKNGVLVLSGYGVRVAVEHGQLAVSDGIGPDRRVGMLNRATCGVKRLVLLGHSGTVSLEALRWLHDIGAAVVQIDADGQVVLVSSPQVLDDARLRRLQALAPWTGMALDLARGLIREKLQGQAEVVAHLPGGGEAQALIQVGMQDLDQAKDIDQLRLIEARAAASYWEQWSVLTMPFARKDEVRVPEHWRTFGVRRSPVSGTARNAANPANTLLNYLYAILEAEAAIAARTVGLDPGMGFLHADQKNRDSLACDLMEAVRPQVDAAVLDLLQSHIFAGRDFFETRQGVCRVLPPLANTLAETAPRWAKVVAPIAERVAHTLAGTDRAGFVGNEYPATVKHGSTRETGPLVRKRVQPTTLTQANRSAGRDSVRRKAKSTEPTNNPTRPILTPTCRGCGTPLQDRERQYCDTCLPDQRAAHVPIFSTAGPKALAERRAAEVDPAHGGTARSKRGERIAQQWREIAQWESVTEDRPASVDFEHDVLPRLATVSLATLMEATGLSRRYCWLIKTGQKVPHPRHWQALSALDMI